jgi:DNA polymerase-3 subunit delta'
MARAPAVQETEVLPEADRLGDFPHPRETRDLFGQEVAELALAQAFAGGRMHHAWLLAGRAGIGKATFAYRLARHMLAKPGERDPAGRSLQVPATSSAARQVAALAHPGLLVLRRPYDTRLKRFAASIPIDEVRRLRSFLGLTAEAGGWRVVIVDSADELNVNAANALLKSLEEPPPRALFLLVSSQPSRLLPTIRSRCRRLDLPPLGPASLRQAVAAAASAADIDPPSAEQWRQLERLADGSVRLALQLANGGVELYGRVAQFFARLPEVDWPSAHALADSLAGDAQEQRFETFFGLLHDLLARLVRLRAAGSGNGEAELALAARLIPEERLPAWAETWQVILRDKSDADELNLDRKALIVRTFARIEAAARGRDQTRRV